MKKSLSIFLTTLAMVFVGFSQTVVYVDPDATGNNDGTSWADAYTDLENAMFQRFNLTTDFWMTDGVYKVNSTSRTESFSPIGTHRYYGGFSGNETKLSGRDWRNNHTILSGDIGTQGDPADNNHTIIEIGNSTITFDGIHFTGGYHEEIHATLQGGAGIQLFQGNVTVENCSFYDNYTSQFGTGAGIGVYGGGTVTVINSFFYDNVSDAGGPAIGSIQDSGPSNITVYGSVFYNNQSNTSLGTAIAVKAADLTIVNSTFYGNDGAGGVILQNGISLTGFSIHNSIFWDNDVTSAGANRAYVFTNSTFTEFTHNLTEDAVSIGSNNISSDPIFVDAANNDFRIYGCSPAVDASDDTELPSTIVVDANGDDRRAGGSIVDIGAYESSGAVSVAFSAIESVDILCHGQNTGQISLNASGVGTFEYSIDDTNYLSTSVFSNLAAGTYNVSVREVNNHGCFDSDVVVITEPTAPIEISTLNVTQPACGGDNGMIEVVNNGGGTAPYTINIGSTGGSVNIGTDTNHTLSLPAGTHSFTITDANGCGTLISQATLVDPDPLAVNLSSTDPLCSGQQGTYTFSVDGGTHTGSYTVTINGGTSSLGASTTVGPTNANAGATITVTAEDDNGCIVTESVTIADPQPITFDATPSYSGCPGSGDGAIIISNVAGGTGNIEFSIDGVNFQTGTTFALLAVGNYTVTARDDKACMVTSAVDVVEPASIDFVSVVENHPACNGDSGSLNITTNGGGVGPYELSIDGGVNYSSIGNVSEHTETVLPGSYSVIVRDVNGCTSSTQSAIINNEPDPLVINLSSTDPLCNGQQGTFTYSVDGGTHSGSYTVTVNGGTASLGATTTIGPTNANAGATITVTAEDDNGCTVTESVTIADPQAITFDLTSSFSGCPGSSSGTIQVSNAMGGTGALEFSIDGVNFQSSPDFTGLSSGTYHIIAQDANGCAVQQSTALTEPTDITFSVTDSFSGCAGSGTGTLQVQSVSGGTGLIEYSLDGINFQTSPDFDGLDAATTFSITARDANGCTSTVTDLVISVPMNLSLSVSTSNALCNGQASGSITVTPTGGVQPYSYSIDGVNFQNDPQIAGLAAGNYEVTVADAVGCQKVISTVAIGEPSALTASANGFDPTCFGEASGSIDVSARFGTEPYEYSLDNVTFQPSNIFDNLFAGDYSTYARDANGCVAQSDVTLTDPTEMIVSISASDVLCSGEQSGILDVNASFGVEPYEYSLNNVDFQSSNIFDNLVAGDYVIYTRDAAGCSKENTVAITEPTELVAELVINNKDFTVNASGGTAPYEYSSDGTTFQISNLFASLPFIGTSYSFTVRDANGCEVTIESAVLSTEALDAKIEVFPNPCQNQIHVNSDELNEVNLTLINISGKVIYSGLSKSLVHSIDISEAASGVLLLHIQDTKGNEVVKRIIKN